MQSFYVSCQSRCCYSVCSLMILFPNEETSFQLLSYAKELLLLLFSSRSMYPSFESHSFCANKLLAQSPMSKQLKCVPWHSHFHEEMLRVRRFWSSLNLWYHFWLGAIAMECCSLRIAIYNCCLRQN